MKANDAVRERYRREMAEMGRRQQEKIPDLIPCPHIIAQGQEKDNGDDAQSQVTADSSIVLDAVIVEGEKPRETTQVHEELQQLLIAAASEKISPESLLNNINDYPSLIKSFKEASSK
jgi:hypothetical protein